MCHDTNQSSKSPNASELCAATQGSAGVDLAASKSVTLLDNMVPLIPTGVYGPLGNGRSALLLGRSSTTLEGLFILPGVTDADYEWEIRIMAWTPGPPCSVTKGSKIAQLVYFTAAPPNSMPRSIV